MFSYSFSVKLTDRYIKDQAPLKFFQNEGQSTIKVERKHKDILLITSDGYLSESDAVQKLAAMLMKTKIALLQLKVPHQDWLSFNSNQRFAIDAIGSIFEEQNIVALSYKPQVYETNRIQHWPGAMLAENSFDLEYFREFAHSETRKNFGTGRTLEALNVLSLALAAPHAKSKLILSMTAVELLSDREQVEHKVVDALDGLKKKILDIETSPEVATQLEKILTSAKTESISKAGKRLVRQVLGGTKAKEFYKLYDVRSELIHGNPSRLSIDLDGHREIEKYADAGFNLALDLTLQFRTLEINGKG